MSLSPSEESQALALTRNPADFDATAENATRASGNRPSARRVYFPGEPRPASIHRLLPQSPDAEQGVLSSFLIAPGDVGGLCAEKSISHQCFHNPANATIYSVLMSMWRTDESIDFITLTEVLRNRGQIDQVGGAAYVTGLFTFLPTAANAGYYIEILQEKFTLREIIRVCTEYVGRCHDEQDDVPGLREGVEREVLAIGNDRVTSRNGCTARELAMIGLTEIDRRLSLGAQISGLSTGFGGLDEKCDGLHAQEMIVLAAVPSLGKSALGMQIIDYLAIELRVPCAVFPLEMGRKQLSQRMIYTRAKVNPVPWRSGRLPSDSDIIRMRKAAEQIAAAPLYVEDASDCTIQIVRATVRRLVRSHGVRVVLIDSLSAMHSDTRQGRDNRVREAAECSEGCKQMAKELGITVILVAHIDRKKLRSERPQMSDLRETGKVEQDADAIWFLYEPDFDEEKPSAFPEIELWIPKQRDGEPFVSARLHFEKQFTRFREERDDEQAQAEMPL